MPPEKNFSIGGIPYRGRIIKCFNLNCIHSIREPHWIFTSSDRDLIIQLSQVKLWREMGRDDETNLSVLEEKDFELSNYPDFSTIILSLDRDGYRSTKDNSNIKSAR